MPQNAETPDYAVSVTEKHEALPQKSRLLWYETGIVLGRGGFGITYLARDNNLAQLVAIKEYFPVDLTAREDKSPFLSVPRGTASAYQTGLKRFIREARTLGLFKHPNIVRVSNVFQCNNTAYMVMDYEEGESLDYLFENKLLKTEKQLLGIVLPILDGLRVVHEAGFVHRDIKPSNVYVRKDGSPVLLDFGSARQTTRQQTTKATTRFVTPAYAPFEQYDSSGGKLGPWSDIYALGATLYLIVTGRQPVEALTRGVEIAQHGSDPYQPAAKIASRSYSANFLAAIDRAMMFHPGRRPQSADAWSRMLSGERPLSSVASNGKLIFKDIVNRLAGISSQRRQAPAAPNSTSQQKTATRPASNPAPDKTAYTAGSKPASAAHALLENRKFLIASLAAPALVALALIVLAYVLPTDTGSEQPENKVVDTLADATAEPQGKTRGVESGALAAFQQTTTSTHGTETDKQATVNEALSAVEQLLSENRLAAAKEQLESAARFEPDNVNLARLRAELATREQKLEIAALLADARRRLTSGQLAEPARDSALAIYRQILSIEPDNAAAQRGVQNVIRHYLDAANDLLAAEQTTRAEEQLAVVDEIDFGNPEAEGLRARIKAIAQNEANKKRQQKIAKQKLAAARERTAREALEKQQQERAAAVRGTGPSDADRVSGIIEEFKLAFEQRDIERLQKVAHLSAERRRFIEDLFSRHKAIQVSISELSLERRGSASARITIEKLITNDGDSVIPAPTWRQARLVTIKKGEHWQKLSW